MDDYLLREDVESAIANLKTKYYFIGVASITSLFPRNDEDRKLRNEDGRFDNLRPGAIFHCTDNNSEYIWVGDKFELLCSSDSIEEPKARKSHKIAYPTKCKYCGANLHSYTCDYCGVEYPSFKYEE